MSRYWIESVGKQQGYRLNMTRLLLATALLLTGFIGLSSEAQAQGGQDRFAGARWLSPATHGDYRARTRSQSQPWHGGYYYLQTGQPTALVVPPNANMQQNYSWGVSQNTMTPIYSQFGRGAPIGGGGGTFQATPVWPSHTEQFGVYPVRAPW